MVSRSFELPEADWATVGTVGEPGHRTFYIQARQGDETITVKVEKQHVAAIAQFLSEILSDLPFPEGAPDDNALELVEPLDPEWPVGQLQLAYDSVADRIIVLLHEVGAPGDDDAGDDEDDELSESPTVDPDLGSGQIGLTRAQAAGIARRGFDLVNAGRPRCGLCGNPMDPEGHSCPRTNGHRPTKG